MSIQKYLDKDNLHHAYLIEGARDEIVGKIFEFIKSLGIETIGNADVSHISLDSFKIEDARNLKSYASERGFSLNKKIFIISVNNFLLEAQNSLLKVFEEPIENTHFFIIVPDASALLKTFVSRLYFIKQKASTFEEVGVRTTSVGDVEKFIALSIKDRIEFIKELLTQEEEKDEEENEILSLNSTRSKALKFLNALELVLHKKLISRTPFDINIDFFKHFFKVREFLRQPGSSTKSLMESVALVTPSLSN